MKSNNTHSTAIGYLLWIFGFMGAHRFYFGKTKTGILWFFTLGLLGVGWIIDLFLMPSMDSHAGRRFREGRINYTIAWAFLTFFGVFGVHRFYMGKWVSGLVYLLTGGLLFSGVLYDFLYLNEQIDSINKETQAA